MVSLTTDEMVRFVAMNPEKMFGDVTGSTNKQKKDTNKHKHTKRNKKQQTTQQTQNERKEKHKMKKELTDKSW